MLLQQVVRNDLSHEVENICSLLGSLDYLRIHHNIQSLARHSLCIVAKLLLSLSSLTLPIDMGILSPDWFSKSTKTFYSGWSTAECLRILTKIFSPDFLSKSLMTNPLSGRITNPPYSSRYC